MLVSRKEVIRLEPSERKKKILKTVVESYISTGEPVGSKAVCGMLDFPVSSATVRNDMAELSEQGLLEQPHTSAGRIPSNRGYRYYVDELMPVKKLSDDKREMISQRLYASADEPEKILSGASNLLASLSGYAAISTTPPGKDATVKRIRLVQTSTYSSMVVLITSSGMVKNRLFRCDFVLTPELLKIFENAVNSKLCGLSLSSFTPAFIQTTTIGFGELAMLLPNVMLAIMEAAQEASGTNISLDGETNLLFLPELDLSSASNVLNFLTRSGDVTDLLFRDDEAKNGIIIGDESSRAELKDLSIIKSHYTISDSNSGVIAIIGPVRMDYAGILADIKFISETVGKLIRDLMFDK